MSSRSVSRTGSSLAVGAGGSLRVGDGFCPAVTRGTTGTNTVCGDGSADAAVDTTAWTSAVAMLPARGGATEMLPAICSPADVADVWSNVETADGTVEAD